MRLRASGWFPASRKHGPCCITQPTTDKLTRPKLFGVARAFAEQSVLDPEHLGFEERLGLLVEPDNLPSGVPKASRHEPDVNPTYHLAEHYGVAVLPARARRPKCGVFHHRGIEHTILQGLCLGYAVLDVFFDGNLNDTEA
ncbi:hypothetical protein [Massilia sp. TWR1-2-2]|uniref:hypothetical protein n=1 Tax=Massilia sp. TWR1-2-2 TaxID=2804584 RepID=UPI003CE6FCD9